MKKVQIKRVYDKPSPRDGTRVLVDRVWPRGMKKDKAHIDLWLKDAAPSADLRKWFGHHVARWKDFRRRYAAELDKHPNAMDELRRLADKHTLTLIFSARDEEHNNAVVLREYLAGEN
ncbi:MAG: hypothetical protein BWX88_02744 [Planctomycetes bacterium ADurb.Bin126]|nr:MAG: hypothetical protein BWX88_02744 [Planctomycetes bacterium ADurb.Bin126]HOD82677.1 DUF488 domain-containing protein [Phycisphaerae bacterium]HQL73840.1 DUF488 domain-containing protein [Phycisphaerae bacterium]